MQREPLHPRSVCVTSPAPAAQPAPRYGDRHRCPPHLPDRSGSFTFPFYCSCLNPLTQCQLMAAEPRAWCRHGPAGTPPASIPAPAAGGIIADTAMLSGSVLDFRWSNEMFYSFHSKKSSFKRDGINCLSS